MILKTLRYDSVYLAISMLECLKIRAEFRDIKHFSKIALFKLISAHGHSGALVHLGEKVYPVFPKSMIDKIFSRYYEKDGWILGDKFGFRLSRKGAREFMQIILEGEEIKRGEVEAIQASYFTIKYLSLQKLRELDSNAFGGDDPILNKWGPKKFKSTVLKQYEDEISELEDILHVSNEIFNFVKREKIKSKFIDFGKIFENKLKGRDLTQEEISNEFDYQIKIYLKDSDDEEFRNLVVNYYFPSFYPFIKHKGKINEEGIEKYGTKPFFNFYKLLIPEYQGDALFSELSETALFYVKTRLGKLKRERVLINKLN